MLLDIIEEIKKALDNNMYLAALSLALMVPDICGKAEYPTEKNSGRRFIDWYESNIGQSMHPDYKDGDKRMPYLSGEVVYSLRNCMLHQGTPNIEKSKINDPVCKIDRFVLVKEEKNPFDVYGDISEVSDHDIFLNYKGIYRSYHMSIRRLCLIICWSAEGYYNDNNEKFDFFNYTLVDKGHEYDDLFSL